MHELGIIKHVSKTLEEIAKEQGLTEVSTVTLEIGEVSGIVNSYLTEAWSYFVKSSDLLKESQLVIEEIPAMTFCEDCKKEYETVKYGKECPHCHSLNTYLVQGDECNIKEIEAC